MRLSPSVLFLAAATALPLGYVGLAPLRAAVDGPVEPSEAVELFNGEDLAGWTGDTELFEVEDGVLRCKGGGRGLIQTDRGYTGYVLHLEWRWPDDPGDSGVFLHIGPGQGAGQWPQCIETQLYSGNAGDFWLLGVGITPAAEDQAQQGGRVSRDPGVVENPPGEWNTMTITCDGGYVEVLVNGEVANAGYDATRTHGPIGIQCEGSAIEFRNLRLDPLE